MKTTRILPAIIVALGMGLAAPAQADRLALVVGNDDYQEISPLKAGANDARSMHAALEAVGFDVTRLEDTSFAELDGRLRDFAAGLSSGDEAVFFFAGQGSQIDGRTLLLPVDFQLPDQGASKEAVLSNAVAVDQVVELIASRGVSTSIVIVDTCRDDPLPPTMHRK